MARTKQTARISAAAVSTPEPSLKMNSSGGGVFSETLQSITTTKLIELSKKRSRFEEQKDQLLSSAQMETDQRTRLSLLVDGVRRFRTESFQVHLSSKLKQMEVFLEQARYDPSVSPKLMQDWEEFLRTQLNMQSSKYQYATLYGDLVTEWLSEEKNEKPIKADVKDQEDGGSGESESAIQEKDDQRTTWEEYVFTSFESDQEAIEQYLHSIFGKNTNNRAFRALEELRQSVHLFETGFESFSSHTLKWTISGLLSSDLLTDEKRAVLKDFASNEVILTEIADVLNMRLADLQTWGWDGNVSIDQRRHVNGRYKIYMHEDLLQAIFLQFIGVKWSVLFKRVFRQFVKFDGAWTSLRKPISKAEKRRRQYYVGYEKKRETVQSERQLLYHSNYFLTSLLGSEYQLVENVDGEEEAEMPLAKRKRVSTGGKAPRKQLASKAARKSVPHFDSIIIADADETEYDVVHRDDEPLNLMELKQSLLHLLSTEILFNTHFHAEITVVHSQFEDWNQSIPHSTIALILAFFGVSSKWLSFFQKFLQAPLRFPDEPSGSSRTRQRGVPESHVLSDVFSEVVMFCMDYSVNQSTDGQQLWRMSDDLWFWSPEHDTCIQAWKSIKTFASTMGVALDEEKSGSVRVLQDKDFLPDISPSLPAGPIRWGFLSLNPSSGRFEIDQSMVDTHVGKLKQRLFPDTGKTTSIFNWIRIWNTHAGAFFRTNFGAPANCYGRAHVDDVLATLKRAQSEIFSSSGGSAVEYLKRELYHRFGVADVPDGFLYLSTHLGGLELSNPFVQLLLIREQVFADPLIQLQQFDATEEEEYENAHNAFDNDAVERDGVIPDPTWQPEDENDREQFFSMEEFGKWREELAGFHSSDLHEVFQSLLQRPTEQTLPDVMDLNRSGLNASREGMGGLKPYMQWIIQLCGPEMVERFGVLGIMEKGWLPLGMVGIFKDGRLNG